MQRLRRITICVAAAALAGTLAWANRLDAPAAATRRVRRQVLVEKTDELVLR